MFQTILVPTDFGSPSREAEEKAVALARLCDARCVLLHVIESIQDDGAEVEAFYESMRDRARSRLAASEKRFTDAGVPVEARLIVERRWKGIVRTADEVNADLIVLGSRPIALDGKPVLGTTSHQVFFAATCPLLIIRES